MKKWMGAVMMLAGMLMLMGCAQPDALAGNGEVESYDRIPMVMVGGVLYYDIGRESSIDARCGVMDGEITSSVDSREIPAEDNQSNFGTGYGYQYGAEGTIELSIDGKWFVFAQRSGDGSTISYEGTSYSVGDLSEETLEWLTWYNELPREAQLAVDYVPAELIKAGENVHTEDAAAGEV